MKFYVTIGGRRVAVIEGQFFHVKLERLPACTLGEYLSILTWLDEHGYTVR